MTRTPPLVALALLACTLLPCAGCAPTPAEPTPSFPAPYSVPPGSSGPGPGAAPQRSVSIVVEQSAGAEAARIHAAFASAKPRVSECVPGSGGVIRLRVVSVKDGTRLTFEPSSALGPTERRCVLEALSTVDIPSATADASPSAQPSGFTALFRIEW